jgi:hypothetical protein
MIIGSQLFVGSEKGMKTKTIASMLMAIFLVSAFPMLLISQVAANGGDQIPWLPQRAMFYGAGRIVCSGEFLVPDEIEGDRCFFWIAGAKKSDEWIGRGLWRDLDWGEGKLTAILKIEGGLLTRDPAPSHISDLIYIGGKARVYIDGKFEGMQDFMMTLGDAESGTNEPDPQPSEQPDWVAFWMWSDPDDMGGSTWYAAGQPQLESGDIVTWWYPEYPGV